MISFVIKHQRIHRGDGQEKVHIGICIFKILENATMKSKSIVILLLAGLLCFIIIIPLPVPSISSLQHGTKIQWTILSILTSQLAEKGLQSLCTVPVLVQTAENCSSLLLLNHYGNSCPVWFSLSYISLFQNDCFLPPVSYVLGYCCASVTRASNRAKFCSSAGRALIF